MIWSAIITAIAGIIGLIVSSNENAMTNAQNADLARENREDAQQFNKEEAEIANQRTINNYYQLHSPAAQVQQLKQAGLNPSLYYGKGGVGGSSQAAPMAAPANMPAAVMQPTIQSNWMTDIISSLQDTVKTDTERKKGESEIDVNEAKIDEINNNIKQTQANVKKIEEETKTEVVTRNYTQVQTDLAKLDLQFQNASFDDRLQIVKKELDLLNENIKKTGKEIDTMDIEIKWKPQLYQNTIDLNNATIEKIGVEKVKMLSEAFLNYKQAELMQAQQEWTKEQTTETKARYLKLYEEYKTAKIMNEEYEERGYGATNTNDWLMYILKQRHPEWKEETKEKKPLQYTPISQQNLFGE